jgi:hypothetical protein
MSVTPITVMLKSSLSKGRLTFLLLPFGVACANSSATVPSVPGDGGATEDHGGTSSMDSSSSMDTSSSMDSSSSNDGQVASDGESMGDGASPSAVDLGTAGSYVILAKSGISTVPTSAVTGDLGLSPAAASFITGFSPLTASASNVYSTSSQVTGKVYAADYATPTPSNLTTAVNDMELAFTDAAGRAPDFTELGAGNIGGKTLVAGVYKWSTGLLIPTNLTLSGSAADVWIFQIAKSLTVSSAVSISLTGGAVPQHVFWQVAGLVNLGTTAHFEGVILGKTSIALQTGASINGRLMAQTAVTIDDSTVVEPAQ